MGELWGEKVSEFSPLDLNVLFKTHEGIDTIINVNRFKQVVIKPIAITLRGSDKPVTLTHQTLINAFDNKQPFVSFSKNKNRSVPKSKSGELSFLSIDMTQKEFDGKKYYPSRTGLTTNKEVVKNILEKKLNEETEEEDYGADITEFI